MARFAQCGMENEVEIFIEIGDNEQQTQIEKELRLFEKAFTSIQIFQHLVLDSIFVPLNFEAKNNALENATTYQSNRNIVVAMARVISKNGKSSIILSPNLFDEKYDAQTRFFILFHELAHVWNKSRFSKTGNIEGNTNDFYLHQINVLFDEYVADRISYSIIEDIFDPTGKWADFIRQVIFGFLNEVLPSDQYEYIKAEINLFRTDNNINLFLSRTQETAESIMMLSVHAFSIFHQYPKIKDDVPLENLHFVNNDTFALMNYLNEKYQAESDDLEDGIEFIKNYMKFFGVVFEDRPLGTYCHVIDL
jgi:hypothetical protein